MHKTVVISCPGLTPALLGPHTPNLNRLAGNPSNVATIREVTPAVTCTAQTTYLTGKLPQEHGIVGNGWYFRDTCEVRFWHQSDKLVQRPRIWDAMRQRDPSFTCANLFWWYNMYSTADYSVTPRPMYPADGRKLPDVYAHPAELRRELQEKLGTFPLFNFWGPATNIKATSWIADASIEVDRKFDPTLSLIYLPHMDYVLQKEGPTGPSVSAELKALDDECGKLIEHYRSRGARVIVLSEYGIGAVSRPVHLNRVLREAGLLRVREELGRELLDAGASAAFAVADHQVAHVYVNDVSKVEAVRKLLEKTPGVAAVLDEAGKRAAHLDHPRSGELVCLADADAWFTYYFWQDEARAPDYARTVDIHRKPGYDPVELFLDPALFNPKLKIAWTLAKRKLGMRAMMEVIPTDATLVKGSHGIAPARAEDGAVLITSEAGMLGADRIQATDVCDLILRHLAN